MFKVVRGSDKRWPDMARLRHFWQCAKANSLAPGHGRVLRSGLLTALLFLQVSCSTLNSTPAITLDRNQSFALLAFDNFSATPQADERLRTLLETRLRNKGVSEVYVYVPSQPSTLKALLNSRSQVDEASLWAAQRGARYGFTGAVHEWQYQGGVDSEPTVGVTLSLLDLSNGKVLWQANGSRTGLGYTNLSAIADKTISDLLKHVTFKKQYVSVGQ